MFDTHYANREWRQTSPSNAYVMISGSISHSAELLVVNRVADRSTLMKAIDRSILSCHTLLFLFALFGTPMAARCDTLEDSAKELARKIAAVLPARSDVSLEARNISSLLPDELSRVDQALKTELQNRGIIISSSSPGTARVVITFSENLKSLVWTAEIQKVDSTQTAFMKVSLSLVSGVPSNTPPLVLHSEKVWEGAEPILDLAVESMPGDSEPSLFLLLSGGLTIRKKSGGSGVTIAFPTADPILRDPKGWFLQFGDHVVVDLVRRVCSIDVKSRTVIGCQIRSITDPVETFPNLPKYSTVEDPTLEGDQKTFVQHSCGRGQFLVTSTGDYTQPDTVWAFDGSSVSNKLAYEGPVLGLHAVADGNKVEGYDVHELGLHEVADSNAATAIVRNLKTGNYEAYRLSISCGQ